MEKLTHDLAPEIAPVTAIEPGVVHGTNMPASVAGENVPIDPELILSEPSKADRSKPVKFFGLTLSGPISNMLYNFGDAGSRMRFHALSILPGFVVNHSSNAIGATQLVGEALYFKSSGVGKFVEEHQKGSWKVIFAPPINIVRGVFKKSAFHIDAKQLLNPKYIGQEVKRFINLEEAARVDFARDGRLSNRWSARSGFAGMSSMAIAAALPEEKDNPEITEKMAMMAANNKLAYVGYRLGKGLIFPVTAPFRLLQKVFAPGEDHHIGDGKREFSGIGMTMTGLFSVLAGFRQPRSKVGEIEKYAYNFWQMGGGAITAFAGSQLLLGLDNQQGWTNYGKTQFLRLAVLPGSIKERYKDKNGFSDKNAGYYFGAQAVYQFKNVVASLIGGAQKLPDGRLLDQKKKRSEVQEMAHEVRLQRKQHSNDNAAVANDNDISEVPSSTIANVVSREAAMPERVAAHQEMQQEMANA